MITCPNFRAGFQPGTGDAAILEHVRACDACLDWAAGIDPDILFRAIGGGELIPPGGLDAFVDDVMREVHLRSTESTLSGRRTPAWSGRTSWMRRLAVAATVAAGITGAALVYQHDRTSPVPAPAPVVSQQAAAVDPHRLTTKPVVESYDSAQATIVEVPTEGNGDTKIVMIFDEKLPADL